MESPAFHLHSSDRLERLADALARHLQAQPPADPLAPLEIVVAHPGMARWLEQRLAERLGVVFHADWPLPGVAAWRLLARLEGAPLPERDPYDRERLALRLLHGLEQGRLPLPEHLLPTDEAPEDAALRRWQLAAALAEAFEQYPLYRPHWIRAWDRGEDGIPDHPELDADYGWQAALWRALCRDQPPHLVQRMDALFARLQAGERPSWVPERVILFGISHLPPLHLDFYVGLAQLCPVHAFVLSPTEEWWGDAENRREARRRLLRGEAVLHPLLAWWGREGRDFIDLLYERLDRVPTHYHEHFAEAAPATTALGRIQASLRQLAPETVQDAPLDDSLVVHGSHTPLRACQEALEAILQALRHDPRLRPRDIAILCLDIDHWAPYLEAAFATLPAAVRERLPYVIVDRSALEASSLLQRLWALLTPLRTRLYASDVRSLLDEAAVRRRFRIDEALLPALDDWLVDSGVRWGLDGHDRGALAGPDRHSFAHGEARALLGYALPEDALALFGDQAPQQPLEGDLAGAVGGVLELVARLRHWRARLRGEHPLREWCARLAAYLGDLCQPQDAEAEQLQPLYDALADLAEDAEADGLDSPLPLHVVQALVTARLGTPRLTEGYLAGAITCCALHPLRNLPFRHIHILGLDEREFPRRDRRSALDALAARPRRGDRSPADDDRQMLLETVLAAGDALHLHYQYRDPRNEAVLPPAAPVQELLEWLDGPLDDVEASPRLRRHAPQPFSPRRYQAPAPASDPLWHAQARRLYQDREGRRPALLGSAPLPEAALPETLELTRLGQILEDGPQALLRFGLGIAQERSPAELEDAEPLGEPDPLRAWRVLERLQQAALRHGADETRLQARLQAEGLLPSGVPGEALWQRVRARWQALAARLPEGEPLPPQRLQLRLELPQGGIVQLEGWLRDLYPGRKGLCLRPLRLGRLRPKDRLDLALRLWAARAAGLEIEAAELLYLDGESARLACLEPGGTAAACHRLSRLLQLALTALTRPQPYAIEPAWCWWETQDEARRRSRLEGLWRTPKAHEWPQRPLWRRLWGERESPFEIPEFEACTAALATALWAPDTETPDDGRP